MPWDLLTESAVIQWDHVVSVSYRSCSPCAQWSASRIWTRWEEPISGSGLRPQVCWFGPSSRQRCSCFSVHVRPARGHILIGSAHVRDGLPARAVWRTWVARRWCAAGDCASARTRHCRPARNCLSGGPCERCRSWRVSTADCTPAGKDESRSHRRWTVEREWRLSESVTWEEKSREEKLYLTLVLQFLCWSPHNVDLWWRQTKWRVHRDVLSGAIGSEDLHMCLQKSSFSIIHFTSFKQRLTQDLCRVLHIKSIGYRKNPSNLINNGSWILLLY